MRPKIVILILVVGIGLVALAAVLKSVMGRNPSPEAKAPQPPPVESAPSPPAGLQNPNSSNNAAFLEQLRAAELAKELDEVRELQAGEADNPARTGLLLEKVTHREPEVRKAALEALVALNDTNAIPGLEQAQAMAEDPREKVALMDAIAYLKLPEMSAPVPGTTEAAASAGSTAGPSAPPLHPRPRPPRKGRPAAFPGAPGATQPGTPINPTAAPPQ